MAAGIDEQYLKDLEKVLQAEAALLREGTDLLADPEYRALRELFVDGDLTMTQFAERIENLADTRPDQDEGLQTAEGDPSAGDDRSTEDDPSADDDPSDEDD